MTNRASLRLAATLLFAGVLVSLGAGLLHPDRAPANDHAAVFAEYAHSGSWTAVHLGQFVGMALLIAGLLALSTAIDIRSAASGWLNRLGSIFAAAALALYGVLQAVDGVALKQAVDAWAASPEAEKAARLAAAEAIRWLEWGVRSYQSIMLGLALLLLGAVIARTGKVRGAIGYLMGLSGLAYIAQGWIIGSEGFSAGNTLPTLLGVLSVVVWSVWLMVSAWRMGEPGEGSGQQATVPAQAPSR